MTTSKALVVSSPPAASAASTGPDPSMAAQLHQCVLSAGAISAASAIVCGLQLESDQKALKEARKKSASTCTFDEWLESNEASLGFKRRTAFKYLGAAKETKAKLLKSGDKATLRLLECAPASLMPDARAKLLQAVQKCIGVTTLMDIYLEAGIVKQPHGASLKNRDQSTNHGGDKPPGLTVAEKIDFQMELFGRYSLSLDETVTEHGTKILLISKWTRPRLDEAIRIAKHNLTLLVKVRGAVK